MSILKLAKTCQIEPLTQWPEGVERSERRTKSLFRAGFTTTVDELAYELRALNAESVVLQMEFDPRQQRRDGSPYLKAEIGPSLVLSFEVGEDRFMYPVDTFLGWRENLRAIALTLNALRAVDRYGVSKQGQQYSGWKALPANVDDRVTPEQAAIVLLRTAGWDPTEKFVNRAIAEIGFRNNVYRRAASLSHPDRQGGTEAHFHRVQHALAVLEAGGGKE